MIKLIAILALAFTVSTKAVAHEGLEVGIGTGTSHALAGDDFKRASKTGDANQYWVGYGFDQNWGAELGLDSFDFDNSNSKHQAISIAGVYNFLPQYMIHPLAKLGLGSVESKDAADAKTTGGHAKAAIGIEGNFQYVTVGALFNYFYAQKVQSNLENASALIPALYLTFHGPRESENTVSKTAAPVAAAVVVAKKDSDNDGIFDDEDKCPATKSGVVVNAYGCALTEKASVKLQVEFANGKSALDAKFDNEIKSLADFMAKYPNTNAEIAGHTDNTGKAASNNALSQKRADSVKNALVKAGVDAKRLTSKGYGSKQPLVDNKTAENRQANRRVMAEISVVADKKK
jgi:OmpA-OmpF porin, OOP family